MASAIFDSHGFVKRLTAAGMPEPQAEILADEQFRLLHEQIATKGDIMTLRSGVAGDIVALRSEVARDIEALRSEVARDIVALRSGVAGDIEALRSEVARDIVALRSEMAAMERRIKDQLTIRLGLMLAAAIAVVATLVRLL
jgi:hypothetical protein